MNIRHIREDDAAAMLDLCKAIDAETPFMLFEAGERKTTVQQQLERIQTILAAENSTILVAETDDNKLVGYLTAVGGEAQRNKHGLYIVIGILKEFTGQKIGTKLFTELENWARKLRIHRIGLGLMAQNETALSLYTKMGFEMEGRKKDVFYVNGQYVDEYMMSKILTY